PLSSCETFDPRTEVFAPCAAMGRARSGHRAVLLGGGRVLVVGGTGPGSGDSGEIYDPEKDRWKLVKNSMSTYRQEPTATLLGDKVLIAGGAVSRQAELFFPDRNLFWPGKNKDETARLLGFVPPLPKPMISPRQGAWALEIGHGRVLIGNGTGGGSQLKTTELFDAAANSFASAERTIGGGDGRAWALLSDGRFALTGGRDSTLVSTVVEAYRPATKRSAAVWQALEPLPHARMHHQLVEAR
ncbi:MAG: hypothetical protein HY815_25545, partial [Candidatus Riflebacteria bacterium]|nr:hypothetical protein [Candidatus Riflebacteria bacterium]